MSRSLEVKGSGCLEVWISGRLVGARASPGRLLSMGVLVSYAYPWVRLLNLISLAFYTYSRVRLINLIGPHKEWFIGAAPHVDFGHVESS
jgi:hypothetical protein